MGIIPNNTAVAIGDLAEVDTVDLDILQEAIRNNGVISGGAVTAQASPNMTVQVAAGRVQKDGYSPFFAAVSSLAIGASHATLNRYDLITVDTNANVEVVAGTNAAEPVFPSIPSDAVVLASIWVPANATAIDAVLTSNDGKGKIVSKAVIVKLSVDELDEFEAGSTETGEIGEMGWNTTASGTAANAQQTSVAEHPGIMQAGSGATSGNNSRMHLGNAVTTGVALPANIARMRWIVRVPTITSLLVKFGLAQDASSLASGAFGTAGIFVEFDPATSALWRFITRNASTNTVNTNTTVVANTWYQFDMVRLQNGNWQFAINGVLVFTHTTNIPTAALNIAWAVQTATAAARTLDCDAFEISYLFTTTRY